MSGTPGTLPTVRAAGRRPDRLAAARLLSVERLLALERLSTAFAAAVGMDGVATVATAQLAEEVGAVAVSLSLLVTPTMLERLATAGDSAGLTRRGTRFPLDMKNPVTEAARSRRVVTVLGRAALAASYPDLYAGTDLERSDQQTAPTLQVVCVHRDKRQSERCRPPVEGEVDDRRIGPVAEQLGRWAGRACRRAHHQTSSWTTFKHLGLEEERPHGGSGGRTAPAAPREAARQLNAATGASWCRQLRRSSTALGNVAL